MSKGSKPAALKSPAGAQPKAPKRKAAPPVADDDDEPVDMEALRIDLSRHIATLGHYPRTCPEPQCRRARRCLSRKLSCRRVHPPPQLHARAGVTVDGVRATRDQAPAGGARGARRVPRWPRLGARRAGVTRS